MLVVAGGCASSSATQTKAAEAPAEPKEAKVSPLEAGTTVCISEIAGVRWELEDTLRAHELAPEASCMSASVRLEESGEAGAWKMRYQKVGDSDWKECTSTEEARGDFASDCVAQMLTDLGGS